MSPEPMTVLPMLKRPSPPAMRRASGRRADASIKVGGDGLTRHGRRRSGGCGGRASRPLARPGPSATARAGSRPSARRAARPPGARGHGGRSSLRVLPDPRGHRRISPGRRAHIVQAIPMIHPIDPGGAASAPGGHRLPRSIPAELSREDRGVQADVRPSESLSCRLSTSSSDGSWGLPSRGASPCYSLQASGRRPCRPPRPILRPAPARINPYKCPRHRAQTPWTPRPTGTPARRGWCLRCHQRHPPALRRLARP